MATAGIFFGANEKDLKVVRVIPTLTAAVLFLLAGIAAPSCLAQAGNGGKPDLSTGGLATVQLTVYKKWIGASGDEGNVEIHLSCGTEVDYEARHINQNRPDGWQIENVPPEGINCDVREIERETFVADVDDCIDLLVLPGEEAECTIVNTKVVKRIDMLNRYGIIMMIAVMLGAGLAGVRSRLGAN